MVKKYALHIRQMRGLILICSNSLIVQVYSKVTCLQDTFLPHLGHHFILTLLYIFAISLHYGLQEAQVRDAAAVRLYAVYEVMHHTVTDLITQVVVVLEDVTHGLRLQKLFKKGRKSIMSNPQLKTNKEILKQFRPRLPEAH